MESRIDYRIGLGNRTATDCTIFGKLGLQNSNQLSQIELFSTEPTVFSTGNASENLHVQLLHG